ncbi:MAG TPA: sigma-70 family RNA polymerase sigma factor [Methylorubrum populi]|uniref:Sigma-70 family RNA polymerase sigma factor n=1 Tax=Methylorubrum populi TaxID=223967 RepID=A0A921E4X5_9HYPH|nr:sigma-70 family RNA polymerase sigma factor [Methylorubrum populi]
MDVVAHEIGALYAAERGRLSRFVRRLLGNGTGSEDLVQQVFLRLLTNGGPEHGRATLMAAARNLTLNHLRDIRRRGETVLSDEAFARLVDVAPSPETVTLYRSELRQLLEAVAALPPRRRTIFVLSRFEGLSHAEIGARLDIAPRTVVNQLVAALATLDRALGPT